jgi:hypothetical protein
MENLFPGEHRLEPHDLQNKWPSTSGLSGLQWIMSSFTVFPTCLRQTLVIFNTTGLAGLLLVLYALPRSISFRNIDCRLSVLKMSSKLSQQLNLFQV